jgi:hypothetical protein
MGTTRGNASHIEGKTATTYLRNCLQAFPLLADRETDLEPFEKAKKKLRSPRRQIRADFA